MAEIFDFPGMKRGPELYQALRLIKAFLAISDETTRAHLLAVAESLSQAGKDRDTSGSVHDLQVLEFLRSAADGTKRD